MSEQNLAIAAIKTEKSSNIGQSLRLADLFLVLTFLAAIFGFMEFYGHTSRVFWMQVVFLLINTCACTSFLRSRVYLGMWVFSGGLSCVALCTGMPMNFCLLLFFVPLILIVFNKFIPLASDARRTVRVGMTLVVLILGVASLDRYRRLKPLFDARKQFPKVDLTDRLRFDRKITSPSVAPKPHQKWQDLDEMWEGTMRSNRQRQLANIHREFTADFVASGGFGVGRVRPPHYENVKPIKITDIYPDKHENPTDYNWPDMLDIQRHQKQMSWTRDMERFENPWWNYSIYFEPEQAEETEFHFHYASIKDFLNPASFGYVESDKVAVGFVEHAFHNAPPDLKLNGQSWQLKRLQLVSLLMFEDNRVYELEQLPRMDRLSSQDVATRELNEFETSSLNKLTAGEDLVIESVSDRLMMLGALRSVDSCSKCHDSGSGDLLGAFSYEFRSLHNRDNEKPKKDD